MKKRTTIFMDDSLFLKAQQVAGQQGITFTTVIEKAVEDYVQTYGATRKLSFVGMGHSKNADVTIDNGSEEDALRADIDPITGWSPNRVSNTNAGSSPDAGQSEQN